MLPLSTYSSLDPKLAKIFNEIKYGAVNGRIQPFVVDENNRRIGILTDSPKYTLDVNGTLWVSGTSYLNKVNVLGGLTVGNGLSVSNDATVSGLLSSGRTMFNILEATTAIIKNTISTLTKFLAPNGSASEPSYSFTSDTDNGMYLIQNNNPAISASGTKVLDMSTTGLGVKTTNSPTAALQVAGTIILPDGGGTNQASVAMGVQSGTAPRISLDNGSGAANSAGVQWNIDNNSGTLRIFTAGSLKLTLSSAGLLTLPATGSQIDLSAISAGSPNLKVTATSDTPTVAFTGGGNAPTTAPAGYIEILVGASARYIPFWA